LAPRSQVIAGSVALTVMLVGVARSAIARS
jgi:hypothetical protein